MLSERETRIRVMRLYPEYPPVAVANLDKLFFRIQFLKAVRSKCDHELFLLAQQACLSEAFAARQRGESLSYLDEYAKHRHGS